MVVSGDYFNRLKSLWSFLGAAKDLTPVTNFPNERAEVWKSGMLELSTKTSSTGNGGPTAETNGHSPPILKLCNKYAVKMIRIF